MAKNSLWFTIGLPRSGKSTVCRSWLKGEFNINFGVGHQALLKTKMPPRVVVSDDSIRRAVMGHRFHHACESQVYSLKYGMIRALLEDGYHVLVDDTHTSIVSIQRLLEIDINAGFLLVDTPPKTCCSRAVLTGQEDLKPVIERHWNNICNMIVGPFEWLALFPHDASDKILMYIDRVRNYIKEQPEYRKTV